MKIKINWENIEFWTKIFFSPANELKNKAINLASYEWKSIKEQGETEFVIDYPWEYEKYNVYIQALTWNTNRLNYFVFDNEEDKSFAFIQDPSVLEKLELNRYPQKWYYTEDIVLDQIERLWFEGEFEKIE